MAESPSSIQRLKERLTQLLHQNDLTTQKANMLEEQQQRDRQREQMMTELTHQLMDRQRELNVMLNRANIMLSRSQEANTILSLEFTELCRALPAPEDPDVQDRIQRINDLFRNTGISNAEVAADVSGPATPASDPVIVTPPPSEPQPVAEVHFEVVEEEAVVSGDGASSYSDDTSRLDDLFKRTGDEAEEEIAAAEPAPSFVEPEPPVADPMPVLDSFPEVEESPFVQEPVPFEPIAAEEPTFKPAEIPMPPEPVGAAVAESKPAPASSRRWWQLIGRR